MSHTIDRAVEIALSHHQANRLREAEGLYRRILHDAPNHSVALHYLGVLSHQLGEHRNGIDLIKKSLDLDPRSAYYNNLGEVYRAARQFDLAGAAFVQAAQLDPTSASARNNLGAIYLQQGSYPAASHEFKTAIELEPRYAEAFNNLGNLLIRVGDFDEAERMLRRAMTFNQRLVVAHTNLLTLLSITQRLDEAFACCEKLLAFCPNDPAAHLAAAHLHLLAGRFGRGWAEYEWRCRGYPNLSRPFNKPRWTGQDLTGKTILVHAEQGFGDTFQFIRYVPILSRMATHVIVECQPELVQLLSTIGNATVVSRTNALLDSFDYFVPLLSLPHLLKNHISSIPSRVPYIDSDPGSVARWHQHVSKHPPRLRCGLVWAGRPTHENDRERSCRLSDLQPLASVKGAVFYTLQKGEAANEAKTPPAGFPLVDPSDQLTNFADTAALIANLDLVISIDSAPAHLAGALGKPVWTMLAFAADWRWMLNRHDSPWYPTMRLFRQNRPGDWSELVQRVADELGRDVTEKSGVIAPRAP